MTLSRTEPRFTISRKEYESLIRDSSEKGVRIVELEAEKDGLKRRIEEMEAGNERILDTMQGLIATGLYSTSRRTVEVSEDLLTALRRLRGGGDDEQV